jgi:nicotinamidase/pyrazinamidase
MPSRKRRTPKSSLKSLRLRECGLLVVDAQCGFTSLCPDELPVPGGVEIVANINRLLALSWARIDASQDWHPPDHRSFFGGKDNLYPPHCVQGTRGAEFLPGLDSKRFQTIWRKGYDRDFEAYALTAQHPDFPALLREAGLTTVVVCGLAANICCFFAARDLRQAGFRVLLVEDASAGIDVPAAGLLQSKAREEGQALGIEYVSTDNVLEAAQRKVIR